MWTKKQQKTGMIWARIISGVGNLLFNSHELCFFQSSVQETKLTEKFQIEQDELTEFEENSYEAS